MLIINNYIKNVIQRYVASVTTSFQSGSGKALWLVLPVALIFSGSALFSAATIRINGVIDGTDMKECEEDARYERIYALWGALLTAFDGEKALLPKWSVQEVLAFTTGVHMDIDYQFSEREIFSILPESNETSFNPGHLVGDTERRRQVRYIFEDASLLFYSLQENYKNEGDLSELRLPESLEQADRFFSESLKQDILLPQKTSFAANDRNKWQELVITGLWDEEELIYGGATEESLKNHALVQSILWVGREVIEKIKDDDAWTGPSAEEFDHKNFAETFGVARSSLEGQDADLSSADEYLNEVELSLYWAINGVLFYESRRVPRYDETTGVLSAPSAKVLLAQCFHKVYHSYYEVLTRVPLTSQIHYDPVPDPDLVLPPPPFLPPLPPALSIEFAEFTETTGVSRWLEARSIDAEPLIDDKLALEFLYSSLPGEGDDKRDLLTILESPRGARSVITVARYFASNNTYHRDYKDLPDTPARVESAWDAAKAALTARGRKGPRLANLWIREEKQTVLDELEEDIAEERRQRRRKFWLDLAALAVPLVAEYFAAAAEAVELSEDAAVLVRSIIRAGRAGDSVDFWYFFEQLPKEIKFWVKYGVSQSSVYRTSGVLGGFGVQAAKFNLAARSDYSVSITGNNVNIEVADLSVKHGAVDLFEYFASIRMALGALSEYYKRGNDNDPADAAKLLNDYAQRFDANLSQITTVFLLLPSNVRGTIEAAFSDADALDVPIHSGNMSETADYIFNLEPGKRWKVLEQLQDKYGIEPVVILLRVMMERSAETTARIFMEYQRSTLREDHTESADSEMLQLFLALGERFPNDSYQQKLIAACESLELCGDFLLDVGVWTGGRGYNDEAVADVMDDLDPLVAGLLLGEMHELEEERPLPSGSLVEDVIIIWMNNASDVSNTSQIQATTIYIMATEQVSFDISPGRGQPSEVFKKNSSKVDEYLEDPIEFLLDDNSGEALLLGGGSGGGDDGGNDDLLYRTIGRHVVSKGLDYWVAYLIEQLALARDVEINEVARTTGAIALGTNHSSYFMPETLREIVGDGNASAENVDSMAHLILGLLPNVDLFPEENWGWLRRWFKNAAPHKLGEAINEAYELNKTPPFEERATVNLEDLDDITAEFLENMDPKDAAALLAAMQRARAARLMGLIKDEDKLDAILKAMATSDDSAIRSAFIGIMDAANPAQRARMFIIMLQNQPDEAWERINGPDRNQYLAIILDVARQDDEELNSIARAFAYVLREGNDREATQTILRELLLQGQDRGRGRFVGAVLSYMNVSINLSLNPQFLNQIFTNQVLENEDTMFQLLDSLLSQIQEEDNNVGFNVFRVFIYLSSIPIPHDSNQSIRLAPVFRSILQSDSRSSSYLIRYLVNSFVNNQSLYNSTFWNIDNPAAPRTSSRVLMAHVMSGILGLPANYRAVFPAMYQMTDLELINNVNFQNPLFASWFLFTHPTAVISPPQGREYLIFNPDLGLDRIRRLIRLMAQRAGANQGGSEERWLRIVLRAMDALGFRRGDIALIIRPQQERLSEIHPTLNGQGDNALDIETRITNYINTVRLPDLPQLIQDMRDDPARAWNTMRTAGGNLNDYITYILDALRGANAGPEQLLREFVAIFVAMLNEADPQNPQDRRLIGSILREMISRGEGEFVGQALSKVHRELLQDDLVNEMLDELFSLLRDPDSRDFAISQAILILDGLRGFDGSVNDYHNILEAILEPFIFAARNYVGVGDFIQTVIHQHYRTTEAGQISVAEMLQVMQSEDRAGILYYVYLGANRNFRAISNLLRYMDSLRAWEALNRLAGPNASYDFAGVTQTVVMLNLLEEIPAAATILSHMPAQEFVDFISRAYAHYGAVNEFLISLFRETATQRLRDAITSAYNNQMYDGMETIGLVLSTVGIDTIMDVLMVNWTGQPTQFAMQIPPMETLFNRMLGIALANVMVHLREDDAAYFLLRLDRQRATAIFRIWGSNAAYTDRSARILQEMVSLDNNAINTASILVNVEPVERIFSMMRRLRDANRNDYDAIMETIDLIDSDIHQEIVDGLNNNRRSVLSYSAISDHDGDQYWEPRDDDGNLIANTDHHFTIQDGVRHSQTNSLNYAYHFESNNKGLGMESLEDLPEDPTEGAATFELWLSPSSLPQGSDKHVLFESGGETEGLALILGRNSVTFSVSRVGGFLKTEVVFPVALPLFKFSHVVGIIDQTRKVNDQDYLRLYVNGEPADPVPYPTTQISPTDWPPAKLPEDWTFDPYKWCDDGNSVLGSLYYKRLDPTLYSSLKDFKGMISEFHFYDRALSAEEVSDLYQLRPAAPDNTDIQEVDRHRRRGRGAKYPELSWSEVPGVSGYNIYRTERANAGRPYPSERIASIDGSASTIYVDEDAERGKSYSYWITSHNHLEESNFSETLLRRIGNRGNSSSSSNPRGNRGNSDSVSVSTVGRQNTAAAAMTLIAEPAKPEALVLADYEGGGLAGLEIDPQDETTSYLVQDEVGDTMREFVVDATRPNLHYIKQFDVAEDVSNYDQLAFDYRSQFYDSEGALQIQLRFANKERPGVRNFWNCKSSVPLSAGYGDWTRVFIDLSEANFQLGVDWQLGCDFNLDMLEGVAVMIRTNGSDGSANIIDLDNIQLLVNENE